jgi:hypothetical protein
MAAPAPLPDIPPEAPEVEIIPPVPISIENVLIDCGFTDLQAEISVDQGLNTCLAIALMTPDQIDKLYELNRPPAVRIIQEFRLSARSKFLVFRQWLLEAYALRFDLATVNLDLLTEDEMARTHRVMISKVENKRLAPGKQSDLKPTSVYSGSYREWHNWNTELQSYLGVLTNADGVPLSYIIRDDTRRMEMINLGGIFALTFEVPIEGNTFDRENHAVHLILKRHIVGGTAETCVTQFEGNGIDAYLALATARDGANSQHTIIRECQEWLNQAHFDRDTARFTFIYYCDKLIQCYNELEQRNVFTNEYLKVDKFLYGITNSSFHSIKTTIIDDNAVDDKMNDLQLASVYANTAAVALGFISSTSNMSPRQRIGMHDYEESNHAFGSKSDTPWLWLWSWPGPGPRTPTTWICSGTWWSHETGWW